MKRFLLPQISLTVVISLVMVFSIMGCGGRGSSPPTWSGTKQLGTSSNDHGNGVAVDGSGNVFVTGNTEGGLDGNTNAGNDDIFLVKYNSAGVKQWIRQLGTSGNDYGFGIAVDGGGNIFVTGCTEGVLDGDTNAGMEDIFLVKYDSTGTKQWTRQLGTSNYDRGFGVAVDSSGYIFVTGFTCGGLDGNTNTGGEDVFLVKYDSTGSKQWTKQLGTSVNDGGYGVAVDGGGNVFVTGAAFGGLDGNTPAGGEDIFLVKYNSAGVKQWTQQLGTSVNDGGNGVAVDGGGNIFVTGSTQGGLGGYTNAGNYDIVLLKYVSSGDMQWTRQLGTSGIDQGVGVAVDGSGNVFVTGSTQGGLDGNTNAGLGDSFLVKYTSAGVKQWTRQLGTSSDDYSIGVAVDGGNIFVTGSTDGGLNGNTNAGSYDMFLVKYNLAGVKQ